jgi:hypothetical protein
MPICRSSSDLSFIVRSVVHRPICRSSSDLSFIVRSVVRRPSSPLRDTPAKRGWRRLCAGRLCAGRLCAGRLCGWLDPGSGGTGHRHRSFRGWDALLLRGPARRLALFRPSTGWQRSCTHPSTGDNQLTQFNNPNNAAISLLAATSTQLYVGFDNSVDGIVVFRSALAAPSTRGDFEGQQACSAADHPATCAGLGGNGLDGVSNTRIFHGVSLTFAATDYVYLAAGDGTSGLRVYRMRD